jgi:histidine triad (HIT) family protein
MTAPCIFCSIIAGDHPGKIIFSDETVVVIEDIAPQAPFHCLIIPRRHIPTVNDLTEEDASLVGHVTLVAARLARKKGFAESGFRLVVNCNRDGGQTVWHIHFHLLAGRHLRWPPG